MDIFVYTLPDRIKKVFTTLYMEVDRLLVQFQQFSSYLSRGNSISYKEFDKTHQYHKDFLTELLTCIEDMMDYIDSMTVTVDPEGKLWFSNVTRRDSSENFLYACSAASYFRNEYKLGNRVHLQGNIDLIYTQTYLSRAG